ncbi:Lateral signaling target protein 2 like [Schistosoma japonicum]|nr:Lateral signaling target protein 2 like [Schistosoma japonicum]
MKSDVLIDFYLATIKAQMCELQLVGLKNEDPHYGVVMQAVDSARRELGSITFRLLNAALPTNARHKRLFRTKYIEDVDLRNIENCLVSAANKVINFDSSHFNVECDLRPAKPSASEFLDTHGRIQALVVNTVESCINNSSSCHTKSENFTPNEALKDSTEQDKIQPSSSIPKCIPDYQSGNTQEKQNFIDSDSSDSSSKNRSSSPQLSPISIDDPDRAQPLKQQPTIINDEYHRTISVSIQVNIASIIYTTPVKLPSSRFLTISPELFHALLELDYCAARFEFDFVRCVSRRIRTLQEADDVQLVTVLFSETLMWGLTVKLLSTQQLADRDPCVLLALPRLSILVGCRLLPDSPIGSNRLAVGYRLPFMFNSSRSELAYLCRQLYALRPDQLCRLTRWLGPNGLPNLIYNQKLSTRLSDYEQTANANSSSEVHNEIKTTSSATIINTTCGSRLSLSSITPNSAPHNMNISYQKSHIWKTCLPGLHRLYKCISGVADRFAREYPTELRFILQKVIEMHDTSDEIDIESAGSANTNNSSEVVDTVDVRNVEEIAKEDESCIDSQLSDENELEEELEWDPFNVMMASSEKKLQQLANLFNWDEVIRQQQHDKTTSSLHQLNLHKLFKESNSYLRCCTNNTTNPINKSPCVIDSTGDCSIKPLETIQKRTPPTIPINIAVSEKSPLHPCGNNTTTTTIITEQIVDEIGLDIAACLDDDSYLDNLTCTNPKSIPPVIGNNNQPSTFSQRLQMLNIGLSFEGTQNPTDQIFNYLPPWQPDSPSYQNRLDISKIDSADSEHEQIDDDPIDSNDDIQSAYIVGRYCASCNRSFNLIRRRHHCRRCGHIFCSKCCNYWQSIEGLASNKPVRICSECHDFLSIQIT